MNGLIVMLITNRFYKKAVLAVIYFDKKIINKSFNVLIYIHYQLGNVNINIK